MSAPSGNAPEASILEGRLEDFPLADILQVLQVSGKSGALFLRRTDGQNAVLAFRSGQIVQAITTDAYQTLGDRLVQSGIVKRSDLHDALQYMAHFPGMRLGDALVDRGYATRPEVENEVKAQMAETIERLMRWNDAEFEFRMGIVSVGRGVPDFAVDLVLDKGIEPRHILLEASLLKDKRAREGAKGAAGAEEAPAPAPPPRKSGQEEEEDEAKKIVRWFDQGAAAAPSAEADDPEQRRIAESFLSLSEELFVAQGRGEIGLLLLRYASELYADGGLVLRDKSGFRVLGQFGEAFWWGGGQKPAEPKTHFESGDSPLFDAMAADGRPYAGFVAMTPQGGLKPVDPKTQGAVPALAVPLLVLGNVSLILFCRTAVAGAPDARALIALARQVSITLENMTLREMARRAASA